MILATCASMLQRSYEEGKDRETAIQAVYTYLNGIKLKPDERNTAKDEVESISKRIWKE